MKWMEEISLKTQVPTSGALSEQAHLQTDQIAANASGTQPDQLEKPALLMFFCIGSRMFGLFFRQSILPQKILNGFCEGTVQYIYNMVLHRSINSFLCSHL